MSETAGTPETGAATDIYSVGQLNREARQLLETALPNLWVAGEISNLAQPGSGHIYFSLKDAEAQVRCAMFRSAKSRLRFSPKDGDQVLVRARVSIYEPRGSYQLIVSSMEDAGEGILRRRFEQLKARLNTEGLFADEHKQPLPATPTTVGVITSPTGAAIRDILHVLARRYPVARVIIYPTRVQGDSASNEIAQAIATASARADCDVLIVGRGGGSLEDLWSFNEENVARAIYDCSLPVVSAVGHEVDFTIADLVADVRAPTPSGAAELITPDRKDLLQNLRLTEGRLTRAMQQQHGNIGRQYSELLARLHRAHPGAVLRQLQQRMDDISRQLGAAMQNHIIGRKFDLQALQNSMVANNPSERINSTAVLLREQQIRLADLMRGRLNVAGRQLANAAGALNAMSPLATLQRGYAIVQDAGTRQLIRDANQLEIGDEIQVRLARGTLDAEIKTIDKDMD